ncbi:glycosyltransferase family 2 protein [Treponema sp. OMZ 787]|uniref:glycosyltransferase n=1 Tax=Treponema sp. OMZ 787 TaxID=2563669 RepID=UPI0020A29188|nr:glycosyltransferase family 2 protein [Treponema sp. OMZ 787]UTC61597.1 glycosyltransferase family 2 protein [Treponema sp. OMZ 787]
MITASIVLYNTNSQQLKDVINSYLPSPERLLFLIDNSPKEFDLNSLKIDLYNIRYIFNNKNLGYGAAHNIALHKALEVNSNYHIVLNPDIRFDNQILNDLELFMNTNNDVVYLLPKVIYPNGKLQHLCKLLPTPFDLFIRRFLPLFTFSKKVNDRYVLKHFGYDKIINPPCLSGCFMFLRMYTIKKFNIFFDENFFMYLEDFDIIRRLHRAGKTVFYPNVTIIHDHAHSSYKSKKMLLIHIISAIKYFNKYGWFFDHERKKMNKQILKEIDSSF